MGKNPEPGFGKNIPDLSFENLVSVFVFWVKILVYLKMLSMDRSCNCRFGLPLIPTVHTC